MRPRAKRTRWLMASSTPRWVRYCATRLTSPNHSGRAGTASGEVWISTDGCVILVMCVLLAWEVEQWFPYTEAHVCSFDKPCAASRGSLLILPSACCHLVAHLVGCSCPHCLNGPQPGLS